MRIPKNTRERLVVLGVQEDLNYLMKLTHECIKLQQISLGRCECGGIGG